MKLSDFQYELPEQLIAQAPLAERSASRLLHVDCMKPQFQHHQFAELPALLKAGDLLVLNNTRVLKARLFGRKVTGGRIEMLLERALDEKRFLAQMKSSKSPRPGSELVLEDGTRLQVLARSEKGLFELELLSEDALDDVLERSGEVPLPPYIERPADEDDLARYQTVYASAPGAVAAPTAGLHFDDALLARLESCGIETAEVTLHVGAGTFSPVRVDDIAEHQMHEEWFSVSEALVDAVARTRARKGRIIAVGTTSLRALESASVGGELRAGQGDTDLFIRPGFRFRTIDALITNFHLPGSTLLMLVAAYCGLDTMMSAYRLAVAEQYRFFSYGDAMLLTGGPRKPPG